MTKWDVEINVGGEFWTPTDGPIRAAHPWTAIMRLLRGLWAKEPHVRRAQSYTIRVWRVRQ